MGSNPGRWPLRLRRSLHLHNKVKCGLDSLQATMGMIPQTTGPQDRSHKKSLPHVARLELMTSHVFAVAVLACSGMACVTCWAMRVLIASMRKWGLGVGFGCMVMPG
ncbi:unnamed protein product [Ostreobium quekettii]|uniref:Uncharacterized protein n=1 Tax=Ostreobium quekettii TaxID=121088 RepID=A0A8S1IW05_9CHLO|nr:unnamed protein product [Ostreobium quekettii]